MSGCETYLIEPLPRFNDSFDFLVRKHYSSNVKARQEFDVLVANYINSQLTTKPLSDSASRREPFPAKSAKDGVYLRKKIWTSLPCLQGSAKCGRLMYAVVPSKCTVYLIWIYTHKEFEGRPSDKDLKQDLVEIYKRAGIK